MDDLKRIMQPILRWWWLIVISTILAASSSYFAIRNQPLLYQSRTTLLVGSAILDPNPNNNEFWLADRLVRIYADIASRDSVRHAVMTTLGIEMLPEYSVSIPPDSQFIEIVVIDTSPIRAKAVAEEVANQLIIQSPANPLMEGEDRQDFIVQQLDYLETNIIETQDDLAKKQEELARLSGAAELTEAQDQIGALEDKLSVLQANYAVLLGQTESEATNIIMVLEHADLPTEPIKKNSFLFILLAAAMGFGLAASASYFVEYFDGTLRTPEEISEALGLPIVGYIPQSKRLVTKGEKGILVLEEPNSPEADTFRLLQTGLKLAWEEKPLKTIFVTSLEPGEGKTTVAVNLAAAFAKSGKRVILVDADLRRSKLHQLANIPNELGLSDAFNENLDPSKMTHAMDDSRLRIVTSGSPVANPAEILDSIKLLKILANLEGEADLTIFDGPPLPLPDALVLASKLDGVLIVVRLGQVKETNVSVILDQLKRAQANLLGVVLNRVPRGSGYSIITSLYGYNEYPQGGNAAKLIDIEDLGEPAELKPKSPPPFKEETSGSKGSTASRHRKTTKKKAE